MSDTPIFDMLKFREGFDPLEDVEYLRIGAWGSDDPILIHARFGGSNEWHK